MANNNMDWYALWLKQSKLFFSSAEKHLYDILNNPEANKAKQTESMQAWLDALNQDWQRMHAEEAGKQQQVYWQTLLQLSQQAAKLFMVEWQKRMHADHPVKTVRELYEIWLNACHNVYMKSLHDAKYQNMYSDMMKAAMKYWQLSPQEK